VYHRKRFPLTSLGKAASPLSPGGFIWPQIHHCLTFGNKGMLGRDTQFHVSRRNLSFHLVLGNGGNGLFCISCISSLVYEKGGTPLKTMQSSEFNGA